MAEEDEAVVLDVLNQLRASHPPPPQQPDDEPAPGPEPPSAAAPAPAPATSTASLLTVGGAVLLACLIAGVVVVPLEPLIAQRVKSPFAAPLARAAAAAVIAVLLLKLVAPS